MIIPTSLWKKGLDWLHTTHMGIQKTRLLAHKSIYWVNIHADIEDTIKDFTVCHNFQATQPKDKTLSHEIPGRLWESVRADIFTIKK